MQQASEKLSMKSSIALFYEANVLRVKIETQNLNIYSYCDNDFESCVSLYGDETITQFFDHGKPRSREEVEEYVAERGNRYFGKFEPFGLFSIFDKEDRLFIGQVDLLPTDEPGVVEVGCILHKQYQNRGFGREAMLVLISDYVDTLNEKGIQYKGHAISKVICTVHPENQLSRNAIRKLGMVFDKSQERFGNPRLWFSFTPASIVKKQKEGL